MKKHHAHLILFIFDFCACVAVYWCVDHFLMVNSLIDSGADEIVFEDSILYIAFTIVVPVIHGFTWLNKKDWAKFINNRQGIFLAFIIVFLGVTKYYLVSKVEEQLEIKGYVFCSELIKGRYHYEVYQKTSCSP
jgi:hypothetical protein